MRPLRWSAVIVAFSAIAAPLPAEIAAAQYEPSPGYPGGYPPPGAAPSPAPYPAPYPPQPPQAPPPPGWQPSSDAIYPDTDPSALTDFRSALDPYGSWLDDPTYGTVWVPAPAAVGSRFQPYLTAGHWAYDNGWTWLSDYPWGWVTFHYGRWAWVPAVGWAWVPGRQYAGAWVDWRVGDGYVGWAPQPPQWIWRDGFAAPVSVAPSAPYVFAPRQDLFASRLSPYVVTGPAYLNRTVPYRQSAPPAYPGRPIVSGPAPAALGIPPARVVRPSVADPGLRRAVTFARPATAVRLGARPPAAVQRGVTTPQAPVRPPAPLRSARPSGSVNTAPPAPPRR